MWVLPTQLVHQPIILCINYVTMMMHIIITIIQIHKLIKCARTYFVSLCDIDDTLWIINGVLCRQYTVGIPFYLPHIYYIFQICIGVLHVASCSQEINPCITDENDHWTSINWPRSGDLWFSVLHWNSKSCLQANLIHYINILFLGQAY